MYHRWTLGFSKNLYLAASALPRKAARCRLHRAFPFLARLHLNPAAGSSSDETTTETLSVVRWTLCLHHCHSKASSFVRSFVRSSVRPFCFACLYSTDSTVADAIAATAAASVAVLTLCHRWQNSPRSIIPILGYMYLCTYYLNGHCHLMRETRISISDRFISIV